MKKNARLSQSAALTGYGAIYTTELSHISASRGQAYEV